MTLAPSTVFPIVHYLCCLNKIVFFISEPEDKAAKMRRAVRANNFTQQTNALDVDKHMYVLATLNTLILSRKLRYPVHTGWHTSRKI